MNRNHRQETADSFLNFNEMENNEVWKDKTVFVDPVIKGQRLDWWRNFFILGIFTVCIVIAATGGGMAYGLAKSAPGLERTTNATLGMRHDTQELIASVKRWMFEKLLIGYPENQDKIWLARGDSISTSTEHILRVVSGSMQNQELDTYKFVSVGVKTLISEFIGPETKRLIEAKIHQVSESIDPNEIGMAIKNFNKLCVTIENAQKKGIVDHANKLIMDVDETVKNFQNGRKITLEAKL